MTNLFKKTFISATAIASIFGAALMNVPAANASNGDVSSPLSSKSYQYDTEYGTQCLPAMKASISHRGQDLTADNGTLIKTIADGTVYKIQEPTGNDTAAKIVIKHNIDGKTYYSVYKNMWDADQYIRVGQSVREGQTIAQVGSSGIDPHPFLYLEIWENSYSDKGKTINPTTFLKSQGVDLKAQASKNTSTKTPSTCTYYTTAAVSMRSEANGSSKVLQTVPKQKAVKGAPKAENDKNGYIKVSYNGKTGWISKSYISPDYDTSRIRAKKLAISTSYTSSAASKVSSNDKYGVKKAKPEYVAAKKTAMKNTGIDYLSNLYASCDRFVATISRNTMDTTIPWGSTSTQQSYLNNSSKWKRFTTKSEAQPGDILVTKKNGHVVLYIGQVNGVDSIASASYLSRVAAVSPSSYISEDLVDRGGRAYYGYHYIGKKAPAAAASGTSTTKNVKYTTTTSVNMRKGGSTKYAIVKSLKKGTTVVGTGKVSGSYYQVKAGSTTGYVYKSYLKKASTSKAGTATSTKTKTTTASVNMRTGAGTSYKIVKTLKKGTKVSLTGKKTGNWYQVKVSGKTGYVSGSYLK